MKEMETRGKDFREVVVGRNEESSTPYFQLDLSSAIKERNQDNEIYVDFPITLVNVGDCQAVDVMYEVFKEGNKSEKTEIGDFFRVVGASELEIVDHIPRNNIQPDWAKSGGTINLITTCKKHNYPVEVYFQLGFKDLSGRRYVQKFMFTYHLPTHMGFGKSYSSEKPELQSDK